MNTDEIIRIEGLSKSFPTKHGEVTALKDISLSLKKGEIFGVIGLSGAGKSTLVRCINFLEKPTEGRVIVDGRDLSQLAPKELLSARRSMGMIFQSFNLLSQRSALKNICFPLEIAGIPKQQARNRAAELLALVGLSDKADAYPGQLSGGQKQRVAIARALATQPKVLLCDEATSALDPKTTESILDLLKDINRNLDVTIIVITHEMSVIEKICSRVAVIDNSRIVEMGEVKDIFLRPQSSMAKQLILPQNKAVATMDSRRCIRIVFDGTASAEPIISNLSLECHTAVNILFADTKNIDGKAYGQMLLQLPREELSAARVLAYLDDRKIAYKEETVNG